MSTIPNAWDDDWEAVADSSRSRPQPVQPSLTRAERKAEHAEKNKKLWESAEKDDQPANPHDLVQAKSSVPLAAGFKPSITVLGRRPKPPAKAASGTAADEDDSEEEARKKSAAEFSERQQKAKIEREEKQRKYAEARERLFGPGSSSSQEGLNQDAPSNVTARKSSQQQRKPRSHNRNSPHGSQASSPAPLVDARPQPDPARRLFNPLDAPSTTQSPTDMPRMSRSGTPTLARPTRQPKGPVECGPNGNGFVQNQKEPASNTN